MHGRCIADKLVLQRQRHLKWRALDALETALMMLCGAAAVRLLHDGHLRHRHPHDRPSLAVAAGGHLDLLHLRHLHRRRGRDAAQRPSLSHGAVAEALHGTPRLVVEIVIRLVVLGVALCLIYFGYLNFLRGFSSFRMPSMTPIASLYAAIPISGALIALFTVEQLVNGWRNGFEHPEPPEEPIAMHARSRRPRRQEPARERAADPRVDDVPVPVLRLSGRAGRVLAARPA